MMTQCLKEVDKASGRTAADFCNQVEQAWLSLGMRWPEGTIPGIQMYDLFHDLCQELEEIRTSRLAREDVQKKTVAELVRPLCVLY